MAEDKEPTLYQKMTDAFHKVMPVDSWAAKEKEFKILKDMIAKFEKLEPDDPDTLALNVMRLFYKKRKTDPSEYWRGAPFTPSAMQTRWNDLLTELKRQTEQIDTVDVEELIDPEALDILMSIQQVMERDYIPAMRRQLLKTIGRKPRPYLMALHDEVLRTFKSTAARPMPDVAAISEAMKTLGPPATYRTPGTKALPEPEMSDKVKTEVQRLIADRDKDRDDAREKRRARMRVRKSKGNATRWELHWLWCQDENEGRYVPPECGPYFAEFGADRRYPIPARPSDPDFKAPHEITGDESKASKMGGQEKPDLIDADVLY